MTNRDGAAYLPRKPPDMRSQRGRRASGKHIRSLAKIWPAAGRAGQPRKRRNSRLATGHARMSPARRRERMTRAVAGQPLLNAAAEEQQREGEEKGLDQCMYNGCMCFPKIYALSHANSVRLT